MKARRKLAGLHAAEAALEHSPDKIVNVWLDERRGDARIAALVRQLDALGIVAQTAGKSRLDALAEGKHHQGVVMELLMPEELGEHELRGALENPEPLPLFLVLDQVQDPHNLGACLRTADAAGVRGVVLTKDQAVGITPTVAKVASGAAETVPIYRVTNLARALGWMKDSGIWVAGAAGEAERSVYQTDLNLPLALVVGAEGKGLRRLTRERCDFLVKIPMAGQVESLNLSVATGILLFEAVRQRLGSVPA
ncbi:23S rRNA (guanosine(2251)-2'-O)-methyltransferase RlmB [Methylomagnum ishizawai]|uniref:23S rRNA (guanosine(2251)-2'-O)-methyltransferase RlmB n=1 Tax=Methylomagnum ishizawai TaxID=1760988 RepID=UPI001C331C54|nr:23S rRNA (guanosine(2251)-2'-O)-methyltransferase RlmB [Methylomagnum ishizawai]BBL76084.1 23S rRNA (guanosine-2'-O-)-methyltransferase RlmB [Methylomagnum ishizawai]